MPSLIPMIIGALLVLTGCDALLGRFDKVSYDVDPPIKTKATLEPSLGKTGEGGVIEGGDKRSDAGDPGTTHTSKDDGSKVAVGGDLPKVDVTPPTVDVGGDKITNGPITRTASVTDTSSVTLVWAKVSGPGDVSFSALHALTTEITVSQDGTYVLRLTATDAAKNTASDSFQLTVDTMAPPPLAGPPVGTRGDTVGTVKIALHFPSDVSDYAQVVLRRLAGGTPPADCSAGEAGTTLTAVDLSNNLNLTVNDDPHVPGTDFSYRICIKDRAGNLTMTNTLSAVASKPHIVFATSQHYAGDLGGTGLPGVERGDALCTAVAQASTLTLVSAELNWRAALSDSTIDAKAHLVVNGSLLSTDNSTVVGINRADLWDGNGITAFVFSDESNGAASSDVWTGTTVSGTAAAGTCIDWTDASSGQSSATGDPNEQNNGWIAKGLQTCDETLGLYCVSQYDWPPLDAFTAEPSKIGGGRINLVVDPPSAVSVYGEMRVYRLAGATAPPKACAAGTLVLTIDPVTTTTTSFTDATGSPSGLFSYRACAFDRDGLVFHSKVVMNVTASP